MSNYIFCEINNGLLRTVKSEYFIGSQMNGRGAGALNRLPLLFCKSVYIDNLMKLFGKGLVIMTKKLHPGFSKVAYGLCTEILDNPRFFPILEGC